MAKYKVCKRCSVLYNKVFIPEGKEVPENIPQDSVDAWLKAGQIHEVGKEDKTKDYDPDKGIKINKNQELFPKKEKSGNPLRGAKNR